MANKHVPSYKQQKPTCNLYCQIGEKTLYSSPKERADRAPLHITALTQPAFIIESRRI